MKRKYILAHDLGTTGDKAVLFDVESGQIVGNAFLGYPTNYVSATWAEQDPSEWWRAFCYATREVLARTGISSKEIAVISFSGQMMGCLPVAKNGEPLRAAIIWADQRAIAETQSLLQQIGLEEIYRITGHRLGPAYSAPKIMWLMKHEPQIFEKTYKFLQAKDFIVHRLTHRWVTDHSDACGTGLLDIHHLDWSEKMLAATGIRRELLPDIVPSTTVVGEVVQERAAEADLVAGIPVVIGGGDGVCATAGAGVVYPGIGHIYLGSSAWVAGVSERPVLDPQMRTFTWPHLDPRLFSPNGTMHNAGSSLEWAKETLGSLEIKAAEWLGLNPYDLVELEAQRIPPGCNGLLFLPYLMGERSPYWNPNARGVFLGITRKHTRAHFLRAIYEGVALNLRTIFLALQELGVNFEEMRAIGGGVKSRFWAHILADVFGTPLYITSTPLEATALGAAMAGAVGVGLLSNFNAAAEKFVRVEKAIEPGPSMEVYTRIHKLFLNSYKALRDIFDQLVIEGGVDELA
jgi:xylulokinase